MSLEILNEVFKVIEDRRDHPRFGSYVSKLISGGLEEISEKIKEEAYELIEAARAHDKDLLIHEATDLIFHILVLLAYNHASLTEVLEELQRRRKEKVHALQENVEARSGRS